AQSSNLFVPESYKVFHPEQSVVLECICRFQSKWVTLSYRVFFSTISPVFVRTACRPSKVHTNKTPSPSLFTRIQSIPIHFCVLAYNIQWQTNLSNFTQKE